jgi:hypothetical protein
MTRRRWLWLTGIVSTALFVALALIDRRMQDTGGPGIISFELAVSTDRALEILAQWGEEGKDAARLSLWLDFPYLVAYGAFFSLAVAAIRDSARARGWDRYVRLGAVMVALPIAAAAFDAVEDIFLLLVIGGHADSAAPAIATAFAICKFISLGVAEIYLLAGLVAVARAKLRERRGAGSQEPTPL